MQQAQEDRQGRRHRHLPVVQARRRGVRDARFPLGHPRRSACASWRFSIAASRITLRDERGDDAARSADVLLTRAASSRSSSGSTRRKNRCTRSSRRNGERDGVDRRSARCSAPTAYNEVVFSYANNINTIEGGMHLHGFRTAVTTRSTSTRASAACSRKPMPNLSTDDCMEGLTAVVSVKLQDPQFEGQTKTKLGNAKLRSIVDALVTERLDFFFEENPKIARAIVEKCMQAQRAREAAKKARDLSRRKNALDGIGTARQARRLQEHEPGRERDLPRRRRLGRRHRQGRPRSEHASDPAAARQDPQRREGASRQDARATKRSAR